MGQVADGVTSANTGSSENAEPGQSSEPASRGLLSRFFGQRPMEEEAPQVEMPPKPAPAPLGLGNLRKMRVGDVAIPKVEIEAVPVSITRDELVEKFRQHGYSRLPVFKETLDTPLGLVHLKDLALEYGFGSGNGRFSLRKLIRPLLYVPPSMPIGVLLQKMQVQRTHMALVIDEYGGVDGLLTLEDLIEQVIGEIEDEHDEADDAYWREEKPGQWVVQARAPVNEFEAQIGMRLSDEEADDEIDSMGGLVFMQLGRVPARGEVVVTENGVEYEVVDADPRRIKRLRVRLPGVAPAE
ncbi:magnesium/cobalt efflux protein [Thioclava sediminum]|uniref:Magnesium/cobalt efflux protein n=5 Tax=Thioclava TaxID=285107 RepID=A0ABM6IHR5_9RHOB|nr:magnesium/cobalt efflux protein [Thioclava nitratireducens]MPQ93988.1 HlyC/CorC family transporter [Thioclava sp. JE_KL1]OOY08703.1 magnesium/cobalt efflux protein [Thioclava sp. F36-7]OOY16035.1 magnesium/cobalt efflux protein [Thioclava sp. DLFJ4-1]OOY20556.1 magnesium/cobalt efflux protein [Thioclava sp. DLFJ5-1]OOY23658.1 magnesium/cobalt efflux protein [Thioclava sediminum]OOY30527.1 magnesium/cobalt efflux protein [Thioclava sp. F36-6]OWY04859.1 magnesium/cobalt efflux protein [Thio